jgi:hypothetical protein
LEWWSPELVGSACSAFVDECLTLTCAEFIRERF